MSKKFQITIQYIFLKTNFCASGRNFMSEIQMLFYISQKFAGDFLNIISLKSEYFFILLLLQQY